MGLYFVNWVIFHGLGLRQHSAETKASFAHLVFGAIASALYKAFAVPTPVKTGDEPLS